MSAFTPRRQLGLALLLAALSAIGPFSIDTFLPAMRAIGTSLGASPVAIQQALTVYLFCYALMMLWHGSISDAVGRRPVVLATTLLFGLASVGCALAPNLETLLSLRAVQGLCGGAGLIVGRAVIRDCFDGAAAQRMMSQVTMLFSLAPAIAPVVGGWLFGAFGWHAIFAFMALVGFVLFVLSWFGLPETHPHGRRQPLAWRPLLANYKKVGRTPAFFFLAAAVACNFAGFFVYIPSAPVFLMQHLHLGPGQFLYMFGPAVSGIMLGAWLSGRMAGRRGARETVTIGYGLMLLAMLANVGYNLFFPPSLLPCVLPLMLYTTGMSLVAPTITLNLMDQFPELRGTVSSLQGFGQTMLGSLVAGVISPLVWGSPLTLALTMGGFLFLGGSALLGYRRHMTKNKWSIKFDF